MMPVFRFSLTVIVTWYAVLFEGLVISAQLLGEDELVRFAEKLSYLQSSQNTLETMVKERLIILAKDLAQETRKITLLEASQLQLQKSLAQETEKRTLLKARFRSLWNGLSYGKQRWEVLNDQLTQLKGELEDKFPENYTLLKDHQDTLQKSVDKVSFSRCVPLSNKLKGPCAVPDIANGTVDVDSGGTFVTHDQTVTIRCHENYRLDGPSSRKCYNGTIESLPRCVEINRCERINRDSGQSVSSYGEMCYIYYNFEKTWNGSDRFCREKGGNLVEILNEGVMQHIKGKLNSLQWRNNAVWIGARRSDHIWRWTTGWRVTYDNFAPGQRDCLFCMENCATMLRTYDWKWVDYPCRMLGFTYRFICQFEQ